MLVKNFLPCVTEIFGDCYISSENEAPAHTYNMTQKCSQRAFHRFDKQDVLASLKSRHQFHGLFYLVHLE